MAVMDHDRWRALEPLLDQALDLPPDGRARWLDELRTSSPGLADELASLLREDAAAERRRFLEPPAHVSLAGQVIGAYTLIRPLGDGGMGSVWLARRTDGRFEGVAAVKLLNLGLLTDAGQERFRREGSALARLTHAGIARLLDAGVSAAGQPYLVLEHVDGQRIDEFVRERALPPAAVVALMLQVLAAVGHAHASLIVHRDLKPSNILVTREGVAKLLDFGIAKLLDEEEDSAGGLGITTEGNRALTPEYAAPEQVRGEAITTATDVYTLGVLLYVLLSGRHPTAEGCRTSTAAIQAMFERQPARLGLGDLDDILLMALRRAPTERYQTVAAFADDLQRWLAHEPVRARAGSVPYRARRFLRRHRTAMVAGVAGLALAGGYVAMVLADRARVRTALAQATTSARKAEQVTEFSVSMFESAGQGQVAADSLSARTLLDHAVTRAHELAGQPEIEAQMLDMVGRIRTRLGDYAAARPVLDQALAIRRRTLGDRHPDVATSLMNLAALLDDQEKPDSAIPLLRQALALRRETFGPADARSTDALYALASDLHSTGDRAAARPLFDEWMTLISHQPPQLTPARAEQLHTLAQFMTFSKRYDRGEQLARQALALDIALYGDRHDRVATDMAEVGSVLSDMSRERDADPWLRRALAIARANHPAPHVEVGHRLRDLGFHLINVQQWPEAEATWREAAEVDRETQGSGLAYANARTYMSLAETMRGRPAEAARTLRGVLALPAMRSAPSPVSNRARLFLGVALCAQKRYAEAEPLLVDSYEAIGPIGIPKGTRVIAARSLVTVFTATGRPARADPYRSWASR